MRILSRKRTTGEKYYLQHSIRLSGKVITKEKYLGKEIPKNINELKKTFLKEKFTEEINSQYDTIKKNFLKEWEKYPESVQKELEKDLAIAFTYNTNSIEGSTITLEETEEIIKHNLGPRKSLTDIKETETHAKLFFEILLEKKELSLQLILEWHKKLFLSTKEDIAGQMRDYNVKVGNYRAPDWQDVKKLMNELFDFYHKNKKMNSVELAARTHYKFEKIHPFGDGNGRIGRLIMNCILWQNKYPMLIIEFKKRKAYYKALAKDEEDFLNYFRKTYLKAHKNYLK